MAVGDVINGIGANTTALDFQPAATVEICITSVGGNDNYVSFYNGVTESRCGFIASASVERVPDTKLVKMFISNTNYLRFSAPNVNAASYSGIQIK